MTRRQTRAFLRLVFSVALLTHAFAAHAGEEHWLTGTARVLPQGQAEVGVFQALRLGVGNNIELSTHPLLNVVMPNLSLKKAWGHWGEFDLATRHSLTYPTGLLIVLSRRGAGGILGEDTRVPQLTALTNELLATRPLGDEHLLTAKVGVTAAARFGRSNLPSIDLPLVYPRTAPYQRHPTATVGVDLDRPVTNTWGYFFDVDVFLVAHKNTPFFIEHSGLVTLRVTENSAVQAGYKVVWGRYPFGSQWNLLPLIDWVWTFD
jgi:hypothetical protein